jgi:hypothetical protein
VGRGYWCRFAAPVPGRETGFKVSRFQGFKVSRFQGFKVSRFQGFKVSRFQGEKHGFGISTLKP